MSNIKNQRKAGVILSYISLLISTLVQLLYTPFLIRMLGQSEYGLYSLVASVIGYLTVLDLGFGNAIVVYTVKYREKKEYTKEKKMHGMFKIIFYLIGIIVGILGIILYLNVNKLFGQTMTTIELRKAKIMMLILTVNLVLTFIFNIYTSIINAYEKFIFQKITSILNTILKPIIMLPLLFLGYKSITMCLTISIINLIILISNYIYCIKKLNINIKYQGFDKKLFIEMFSYSFFIFLGIIVDKVNWSVDQFILGAISGTTAVSLYSVASTLNTLFINLSTAISGVMLPKVSKMIANEVSDEEITNEFIKVGRIQFYIIFLMITGFIFLGKEFIILWAGKSYINSYYITVILLLPAMFSLIQNLGISIMQAKNLHKFRSVLLACIAIINIFISIPLAKNFQGIGSAIGTSLSVLIGNVLILNIYYHKKVKINIIKFWKNIGLLAIKYIPCIIIIILLINSIELHGFLNIIIFGTIYVLMYSIISYFLAMNNYEKELVKGILKKFLKKGHKQYE